ncbi:two-component sensor histidine kinase, partial [Bacillus pseudomycoides]
VSEGSISNFQSSIIDFKTLSTAINHLLQPSQTATAKENAANLSGESNKTESHTKAEQTAANTTSLHTQNAE